MSLRIPGVLQSNQVAELVAILHVSQKTAPFAPLHIISDSKYVINGLTKKLHTWEERGWIGIANKENFKATVSHLRQRGAVTSFQWVKGHAGDLENKEADGLVLEDALKPNCDYINFSVNKKFDLTGAQLSCICVTSRV